MQSGLVGCNPGEDTVKSTIKQINAIVERARSGLPLELPEGKTEGSYNDTIVRGLYLRVRVKNNRADWFVYWKVARRKHTALLGSATVFDRKAAVEEARNVLAGIRREGLDPHKTRLKRLTNSKVKFKDVAVVFIADCRERCKKEGRPKEGTINHWERFLGVVDRERVSDGVSFGGGQWRRHEDAAPKRIKYVQYLHPLHNDALAEIETEQVQLLIDNIRDRCGKQAARSCRTAAKQLFKWAMDRSRYLPANSINPISRVIPPAASERRQRVLNDDEIRLIWKICNEWEADILRDEQSRATSGVGTYVGMPGNIARPRAVKFALLTGMRRQEIAELQWPELNIDFGPEKYVHIPKQRIKTARDLCNPLGNLAVEELRKNLPKRKDGFVFPPCLLNIRGPNKARGSRNISGINVQINQRITKAKLVPPPPWTFHDLRRTFRTLLSVIGVNRYVAEALINHTGHIKDIEKNYDLNEYWNEKRIAIVKLEDRLRAILEGTAPKITSPVYGLRSIGR
jgi:integrase